MKSFGKVLDPAVTIDGTSLKKDRIVRRLKDVAGNIQDFYGPPAEDLANSPLCVGVHFGAMFIHPMLLWSFDVNFPTYVGTIRAKSYKSNGIRSNVDITNPSFDCSVEGRRVLIVDDIVESGQTLCELKRYFLEQGAADVRTFALLDKPMKHEFDIEVDWIGFPLKSDQWVVGLGLDDNHLFRHFNNIVVPREPKKAKAERSRKPR